MNDKTNLKMKCPISVSWVQVSNSLAFKGGGVRPYTLPSAPAVCLPVHVHLVLGRFVKGDSVLDSMVFLLAWNLYYGSNLIVARF